MHQRGAGSALIQAPLPGTQGHRVFTFLTTRYRYTVKKDEANDSG